MNRKLVAAVVAVAVAGGLALFAAGRTWGTATTRAPFGARQHVAVTGRDVSSALPALGIALVALAVAALAGSGVVRRLAGALVVLLSASLIAASLRSKAGVGDALAHHVVFGRDTVGGTRASWWLLSLVAGVVAAVAGALIAARGSAWTGMGRRFEAPSAQHAAATGDADAWDVIDRGDDPTVVGSD